MNYTISKNVNNYVGHALDCVLNEMIDEIRFRFGECPNRNLRWEMSSWVLRAALNKCAHLDYEMVINNFDDSESVRLFGIDVKVVDDLNDIIKLKYDDPIIPPTIKLLWDPIYRADDICKIPVVKKVISHNPAIIVYWKDGTKTIVKCQEGDTFDEEKGFAMAFLKKCWGNKGNFNDKLKEELSKC